MAVRNWKTGTSGFYFDPANWVGGVAPGSGDIANISGASGPEFFSSAANPIDFSPNPAPAGDTISGQTINFTPPASITINTPSLSNTTFSADTTINIVGSGTEQVFAWYSSEFEGTVNVGNATTPGILELDLLSELGTSPIPTTTNTGTIAIAPSSSLFIDPVEATRLIGSLRNFTGTTIFDNEGTITVAPGGSLIEFDAQQGDSGTYSYTFTNNGGVSFQGGGNASTVGLLETNVGGTGTFALNGGNSTDAGWTQLLMTGNITGGAVQLTNASFRIENTSLFGDPPFVTGGGVEFEDNHSFLLLQGIFGDDFINPFAMPISGFRAGDTIAIEESNLFDATHSLQWDQTTHLLTVLEDSAPLAEFKLNGTYTLSDFGLLDNTANVGAGAVHQNDNGTLSTPFQLDIVTTAPCFVAGVLIATAEGQKPVEILRPGDPVLTADGRTMPVRWIGRRRIDLMRHPQPEQAQPIRVRRDAFGNAMPHRDLLVSPDHAIFCDGLLIPARLLINGATIVQDRTFRSVTYYHLELVDHAILLSDGLPTESYLDTGNRNIFENADVSLILHPNFLPNAQHQRETRSCAPFAADAARVEPVWRRLAQRAVELGYILPQTDTTNDPDLRILADGRKIRPISATPRRYTFVPPRCRGSIRLLSRSARPCDTRPWIEDRRRLGVMLRRITLRQQGNLRVIQPDDPMLTDGWWAAERHGTSLSRWTNGDAVVPLRDATDIIEIEIAGTVPYIHARLDPAIPQDSATCPNNADPNITTPTVTTDPGRTVSTRTVQIAP